jgi:hypothetical protein
MNNRFISIFLACGLFTSTSTLLPAQLSEAEAQQYIQAAIQLRTEVMEFITRKIQEVRANPTAFIYLGFLNDEVEEFHKKLADMQKVLMKVITYVENKQTGYMARELFRKISINQQDLDIFIARVKSSYYVINKWSLDE